MSPRQQNGKYDVHRRDHAGLRLARGFVRKRRSDGILDFLEHIYSLLLRARGRPVARVGTEIPSLQREFDTQTLQPEVDRSALASIKGDPPDQ